MDTVIKHIILDVSANKYVSVLVKKMMLILERLLLQLLIMESHLL